MVRQGVFFIPMVLLLPHLFGVYGLASVQGAADLLTLLMSVPLSVTILREIGRKRRMQMGEAPLRQQMRFDICGTVVCSHRCFFIPWGQLISAMCS